MALSITYVVWNISIAVKSQFTKNYLHKMQLQFTVKLVDRFFYFYDSTMVVITILVNSYDILKQTNSNISKILSILC